jgi:hypothetical protein
VAYASSHEQPPRAVLQLAGAGLTAVDAYAKAGYRRHDGNASMLSRQPEILARLEEIRGELNEIRGEQTAFPLGTNVIAARANVTAKDLIHMQDEFRLLAKETRQLSAGVNAVKEMSILSGHRVEKSEIGAPGEFESMTNDELRRVLVEKFIGLGLLPELSISNGSTTLDGTAPPSDGDD